MVVVDGLDSPAAVPFARPVRIDLNRAGIPELMSLPGIGRGRAEAIVLHRVRHGRFRSVEDLGGVDGLGAKTVAQLRPYLVEPVARRRR